MYLDVVKGDDKKRKKTKKVIIISHKKDNNDIRNARLMDALNWEAAKELGLEDGLDVGKMKGESLDKTVDVVQEALVKEGDRKARLNIRDEAREKFDDDDK